MRYYLGPWVWNTTPRPHWRSPAGAVGSIDLRSLPQCAAAGPTPQGLGFFAVPDAIILSGDYRLFATGDMRSASPREADRSIFASMLGLPTVNGTTLREWLWDAITARSDPTGLVRTKPVVPTTLGISELWVGGHSLVMSDRFDLSSPHGAKVRALIQEDYRRVRQDALDGKLGHRGVPDPQFHRRVLDALGEKYRLNNPEDVFIPADLPKETRLKHSTTITESFNTSDNDILGPDLTWTEVEGDTDIVSLQAQTTAGSFVSARAESALSSEDHYGQVNVVNRSGQGLIGPAARFAAAAVTYYRATPYSGDDTYYLSKYVNSIETHIGTSVAITFASGEAYKCEANGSTIKGYQAGVQRRSETDTSITGNVRCGFAGWSTGAGMIVAAFEAGDIVVGTSAALTGTATAAITEAAPVAGGDTVVYTLTGETFIAA